MESMTDSITREQDWTRYERLQMITKKIVIAINPGLTQNQSGIKIVNAIDFVQKDI